MFNLFKCTVCHQSDKKFASYILIYEGTRTTKLCCLECKEKTHDKWIENGWKLVDESL